MTDTNQTEQKSSFRLLPILLFFLIIAGLAWTAVQLVDRLPAGLSNLASLAESVNDNQQTVLDFGDDVRTIALDTNTTYTAAGESMTLSWEPENEAGNYYFSYACTDGVALDVTIDSTRTGIECDTAHSIGSENSVDVVINSEKDRYADVAYTIEFRAENSDTTIAQGEQTITVVNDSVDTLFADAVDTDQNEPAEPATPAPDPTPAVAGATDTVDPTPEPTRIEPTYIIPVSDPNGRTDLAARFISTGNIVGDTFFQQAIIKNHRGAVQFEVKNLGSKTSNEWTYSLSLPSGGTYTSPEQAPLKPNERALITIGFPTPNTTDHQFTVRVATDEDTAALNDRFTRQVSFFN